VVLQIFLHRFSGFAHVHGDDDQPLAGEIVNDVLHSGLVAAAVGTPGGPELQQRDFPLQGVVREGFVRERGSRESGRGISGLCNSQHRKQCHEQ
jgi:hypothetical protein